VNGAFAYDGFGRRRAKTIGGTTTQFLYDGLNPVQELASGTPTANLLTGLGIDEFFTRTDSVGVRNFLTDALGSSVALADGSGSVQTEYTYEPFGSTTTNGASSTNSFTYTGREADGTGLHYYRARYYSPHWSRFVSEDPIRFSGGLNVHRYVLDNPINFDDPTGLQMPAPRPNGDGTSDFWRQFGAGTADMHDAYREMRERNWQNSDRYYHCIANCRAASQGAGGRAASQVISELREAFDYWKGDSPGDSARDTEANRCGRRGGEQGKDCREVCAPYVPVSGPGKPPFPRE